MNCQEARELADAHLDQELELSTTVRIDEHLQSCAGCRTYHDRHRQARSTIRRDAQYHRAPPELRARLHATLRGPAIDAGNPAPRRYRFWRAAMAAAAAVVMSVSITLYLALSNRGDPLVDEIVSSHVRSLMADHLADMASSDQHVVKPWFNGRLGYSPSVKDLTTRGFPLVGGRLDYIDNRPVAALIYRHRLHVINLFLWPAEASDRQPRAVSQQGYHLLHWTRAGMQYWAVSDLNEAELRQFADEVAASSTPRHNS